MIAVIRDLVVELTRLRIHPVKPVQAPVDLINYVRDAVPARSTVGKILVPKSFRITLVGKHHLIDGVGRSGRVLKAVRSVMPSPAHVYPLPLLCRMIANVAVLDVAAVPHEWIPTTTLLTHIVQDKISGSVIGLSADPYHGGF